VARDHDLLVRTLKHLGQCYQAVFYIDGNDEHQNHLGDLGQSYKDLAKYVDRIKNVVFMQSNVVIINGVAILATNGWWTYNFNPWIDEDQTRLWCQQKYALNEVDGKNIKDMAYHDAAYMVNSVKKLQTHQDVKAMVMVTHTVPAPWLIEHDTELTDNYCFNCMGNQHMQAVLDSDTEKKIQIDFSESALLEDSEMTESLNRVFDLLFKTPKKAERVLSLDDILDKINENGIDSLTQIEKQKLDEYSKK
jgi:hypothetical protein